MSGNVNYAFIISISAVIEDNCVIISDLSDICVHTAVTLLLQLLGSIYCAKIFTFILS